MIILFLALGAIVTGFSLIFLIALSDKKRRQKIPPTQEKQLTQDQFEKACATIIEEMKLTIEEIRRSGEGWLDMIVRNPAPITGGQYLVYCLPADPEQVIGVTEIMELSNRVIQERLSKGIFLTTGRFTPEIPAIGELAPMEFIDGEAFKKLLAKYAPDYRVFVS